MAITYRTITGDLADLLGSDFDVDNVSVVVSTNLTEGTAPIDLANNKLLLGTGKATVGDDGTFSIANVVDYASADVNPAGIQYKVDVKYRDKGTRRNGAWSSGWLSVTANADLSDLVATQYAPPEWQSDFIDDAQALLDAQIDISGISTSDGVVEALVKNTGGAGPLTAAAVTAAIDARVPQSTTTTQGKVELATSAETTTGTDTVRAVTPAGVKAVADPIRNLSDPTLSAALSASFAQVAAWARNPDQLIAGAVTRNSNGAATSAPVVWPDGTAGTYTADTLSTAFPGSVDAYHITYGSPATKTYTQPAVTRDATTGAVTALPAIVVS